MKQIIKVWQTKIEIAVRNEMRYGYLMQMSDSEFVTAKKMTMSETK